MEYPIARVLPLLSPAHLDRDFDYLVPPELDELAQPGVRVRVRFAGRLVDGYLLERRARSDHSGKLVKLERVVSAERVLTPEIRQLTTAVAARYAGTRADVLRLAIPPRHARTETGGKKKSATAQELSAEDEDSTSDDLGREEQGGVANTSPSAPPRVSAASADAETTSPAGPETGGAEKNSVAARELSEEVAPGDDSTHNLGTSDEQDGAAPSPQRISAASSRESTQGVSTAVLSHSASGSSPGLEPDPRQPDSASSAHTDRATSPESPQEVSAAALPLPEPRSSADPALPSNAVPQQVPPPVFSDADAESPGASDLAAEQPDSTDEVRTDTDSSPRSPGEGAETGSVTDVPSAASGDSVGVVAHQDSTADGAEESPGAQVPDAWHRYVHGPAFVTALAQGKGPRAAWQALPGEDWPRRLAELAATVAGAGRSAILMVPDQRDLDRVLAECERLLGDSAVGLSAGLGPAARYRRWLSVLRGTARVVVGTRSAVFAPADNLGLIAIWDDGDDTYAEPRAPYPHAREVAMLRSHETGAAFVAAGFARTAEIQAVVETGWAHDLVADRAVVRKASPRISVPGDSDAALERDPVARAVRIPAVAFAAARSALKEGAGVLVQVPRRGYVPALACAKCRTPARCRHCNGPLALPDGRAGQRHSPEPAHSPSCRWCGITEAAFRCQACGSRALRAVVIGAIRTAEELGRAFPGVPIRGSSGGAMLDTVEPGPQVVVATVGAEPVLPGGYGVALLLDSWALLGRADLRAAEDALRRWMTAATLVRSHGQVFVVAEPSIPTVQTLLRWDPVGHARAELASRAEVGFPPAVRMAAIDGTSDAIAELLATATLPDDVVVLGPVPLPPAARKPFSSGDSPAEVERILLRVDRRSGAALARALTAAQAVRSTHRSDAPLRVQIDPVDIG
ncbi:primosomal protein N' family DNA-binding protein [Nocardia brasiliensis]